MIRSGSRMSGSALLSLLHLCDSLFPVGGFAHSDGLETATSAGTVRTVDDLRAWMEGCLQEALARFEGPAVLRACEGWNRTAWEALSALDAEIYAMRASSAGRRAVRSMGTRLIRTWDGIHPECALDRLPVDLRSLTLPVAFGVVCAASGIAIAEAVEGYFYMRLAAIGSAAMRLMAVGQHDAHRLLADLLRSVPAEAAGVIERDAAPSAFAPAYDIAAMSQQYVHSRLFRS